MSYLVLARKYRPQTLDELVGQQHIARALSNAIRMDRVAHAYLFCGARGTGKTSTARIVAKMLNCVDGPTVTPCGTCRACSEIATGNSIDVYELDAASNRGVNEIRELREGVGYAPARDRHKIYIVDEAHMLTTEASNAFLKTLEEPPAHAIFILATTDPQRLPITIRSRCQRYDFRRIRAADVVNALRAIVAAESVELGDDALYLVAREGDGSMRDSLSVLDQVIAFGGETPSAEEVAGLLGVADRTRTAGLISALLQRDVLAALQALAAAHGHGIDLRTFARNVAMEARDVLVVRLSEAAAAELVDRSSTELAALKEIAEGVETPELERLAHVLLETAEAVAQARHPRLLLEMGIVRLCRASKLTDVGELAARVDGLLRRGGVPRKGLRASPPPQAATQERGQSAGSSMPSRGRVDTPSARSSRAPAGTKPAEEPSRPGASSAPQSPVSSTSQSVRVVAPASSAVQKRAATPTPAAPAPAASSSTSPPSATKPRGRSLRDSDLATWERVLRDDLDDAVNAALLSQAVVQSSGIGRVALGFRNQFYANKALAREVVVALQKAAERAFSGSYEVQIAGIDDRARTDSLTAKQHVAKKQAKADEVVALRNDEAVLRVLKVFSGRIELAMSEQEFLARGDAR